MSEGLRVKLQARDPVRRQGLAAILQSGGHCVVTEMPDVVVCDLPPGAAPPGEAEAPVIVLTDRRLAGDQPAGVLPRGVTARQLDAALRGVAEGLTVRGPGSTPADGFHASDEAPLLTPREAQILTLIGQGMSNKTVARALGISVHTVKFHLEALFAKLGATSRAEAVAKGLRGGAIEL